MGKRKRTGFKRGGVTAVNLKDAVRTAESVLSESADGKKGVGSGVHLGSAAGGGKKKSNSKVVKGKGGKHANTMLIRAHHTVNQQLATAREEGNHGRVKELEKTVDALGGFDMYQTASIRGEELRNHNTARWLVTRLKPLRSAGSDGGKLLLLDVGALSENYQKERSWLQVKGIDLNSQCSFVQQIDFFDYEPDHDGYFDIVSLSLVLNFVGDAKRRGEMIVKSCRHLKDGGMLYIVIPRACVDNSRYTTIETLLTVAAAAGLVLVEKQMSARLANFLFKLEDGASDVSLNSGGSGSSSGTRETAASSSSSAPEKRKVVRSGAGRNNFAILL